MAVVAGVPAIITAAPVARPGNDAGSHRLRIQWGDLFAPNNLQEARMATRGRTTFQKRQKEMARKERQQMKAERRAQRKLANTSDDGDPDSAQSPRSELEPEGEKQESDLPSLAS